MRKMKNNLSLISSVIHGKGNLSIVKSMISSYKYTTDKQNVYDENLQEK